MSIDRNILGFKAVCRKNAETIFAISKSCRNLTHLIGTLKKETFEKHF